MSAHSLYLHIPFCTHRCAYCDFNTYAGQERLIPTYVDALCRELEFLGASAPEDLDIRTIYLGGGTPSLLSAGQVRQILLEVRRSFRVGPTPEISLEANPGTVTEGQLTELGAEGVNRLSLGVQSANAEELRLLERTHDFIAVIDAVAAARKAGFDNLNLDLIFGLPGQSLSTWRSTVYRVLDLGPEHISAYALTLEHGTPFSAWMARGLLPAVDPDLAADMYDWVTETLATHRFRRYEISNWALPGLECGHNLQYWRGLPYIGAGAGAHGYAAGIRTANVLGIADYIQRMSAADPEHWKHAFPLSPATVNHHRLSVTDEMSEVMILGLRLTEEGVSTQAFRERFGRELAERYAAEIDFLVRQGLLEWSRRETPGVGATSGVLRLTRRGTLLGNQVFMQFLD